MFECSLRKVCCMVIKSFFIGCVKSMVEYLEFFFRYVIVGFGICVELMSYNIIVFFDGILL